ncbi:hypothetical protein AUR64_01825 [Haloprofundus marisrubri]|uniref:Uncharacterized protein n=1 Tax=Haloprofundus marisrubri TaxID=1514971 RepID=A0A0W1R448_9EURY|nr:hypothetical protein AUR64_01825 [Haloprofundus marisrubri]
MISMLHAAVVVPLLGVVTGLELTVQTGVELAIGASVLMFCLLMCGHTAVGYVRARRRHERLLEQLIR